MLSYCPWHVIITVDQVAVITYKAGAHLHSLNISTSKFRSDSNLKRITESIDQSFEESVAISVAQSTIQRYGKLQAPTNLTWSNSKEFEVLGKILNSFHLYFCFLRIHKKVVWSKLQCKVYSSVQFSSAAQSCPTLCNPMNRSTPGLPVHHQLRHQSYPTLCDPTDCGLPDSSVYGILQARILEWVAIPLSRDLPDPGTELGSPALQTDSLLSEPICLTNIKNCH